MPATVRITTGSTVRARRTVAARRGARPGRVSRRMPAATQTVIAYAALALIVLVLGYRAQAAAPAATGAGCVAAGAQPAAVAGFSAAQLANAATIVAVGREMGVPSRAQVVAVVTAMQEARLINVPGGDRDSAGLFQQRPSMGWGSYAQVTDPRYAAHTFYIRLLSIPGWASMPVTVAAQTVQRSAYPFAYAKWESPAGSVVAAAAVTCKNETRT